MELDMFKRLERISLSFYRNERALSLARLDKRIAKVSEYVSEVDVSGDSVHVVRSLSVGVRSSYGHVRDVEFNNGLVQVRPHMYRYEVNLRVGDRTFIGDLYKEGDRFIFKTQAYAGPNDDCSGTLVVKFYDGAKTADVSYRALCRISDSEVKPFVVRDLSSRCEELEAQDKGKLYRCRVSFVPLRKDPKDVCFELKYSDHFNLESCEVRGRSVELDLTFPADRFEEIRDYGINLDPEEYASYSVVDELVTVSAVTDYLKEYFKGSEVSVSYLESSKYPFKLNAYADISSGDVLLPRLREILDEFY